MEEKIVLCFDIRVPLETRLATVDQDAWPEVQRMKNTSEFEKKSPLNPHPMEWSPAPWFLYPGYFSHIPKSWIQNKISHNFCINAYCVSAEDFSLMRNKYGREVRLFDFLFRPPFELLIKNHWSSLGFDICSMDLTISAISSTKEVMFAKKYEHIWNEHGLIKTRKFCIKIMKSNDFKPHDPVTFIPVEIYTNHFAPIKNGGR